MTKLFDAVRPQMEVVGADGSQIGRVDHDEGQDRIKLTKQDGGHRHINWDWVDRVEGERLHLNINREELDRLWEANPSGHIR